MGEPQQQPNIAVDIGKTVVKNALLSYFKVPLLIIGGALIFILIIGTLIFSFLLSDQEEVATTSSGWEVGTITEFGANEIPAEYIPIYQAASEKYGVPWNLLAAHHRVETRFSTISPMTSPVGATGHMQFMPLTWLGWSYGGSRLGNANIPDSILTSPEAIKKYGGFGTDANGDGRADPMDLEDAIHTAAKYLAANGAADGNIRGAVFAYNHSQKYVNDVLGFADMYVTGYKAVKVGSSPEVIDGSAWPVPSELGISSPFGTRIDPVFGGTAFHGGIDINGPNDLGKPVVAFSGGVVTTAGVQGGYGNCVIIDHGNGTITLYGHLNSIAAKVGQQVKAGEQIGAVGTTGKSTGPHLHFGIKVQGDWVDPLKYLSNFQYVMT